MNVKETLNRMETEMVLISAKLKQINEKKWTGKQSDWGNLKADVNEVWNVVKLSEVKRVFVRKFEQEIRLMSDFHLRRYQQSMFRVCFFCCPYEILRRLKYYKLIDEKFEISLGQVQRAPRQIYFYIHLLYVKLFVLFVTSFEVEKAIEDGNDEPQIRDPKTLGQKSSGQVKQEQLMSEKNFVKSHDKVRQSQEELRQKLKTLKEKLQQIKQHDWKDIINIEQWCQHSYTGFIQINDDDPIQTFLQFKDCKFKTGYLFQQISTSSIDLRTCLVRRSKSLNKSNQYVINSLHHDQQDFKLRFWLAQDENTIQNNTMIQKYILLAMRIGVKEKLLRMVNGEFKEKSSGWIIHNYLHIKVRVNQRRESLQLKNKNSIINNQPSENSSFQSVSSAESITPQRFWWVAYGQALIKAIVQVTKEKNRQSGNNGSPQFRRKSLKKGTPEAQEHLDKSPQINKNKSKNTSPKTFKQNNTRKKSKRNTKQASQSKSNSNNQSMETNKRLITMKDLDDNHTARQI